MYKNLKSENYREHSIEIKKEKIVDNNKYANYKFFTGCLDEWTHMVTNNKKEVMISAKSQIDSSIRIQNMVNKRGDIFVR